MEKKNKKIMVIGFSCFALVLVAFFVLIIFGPIEENKNSETYETTQYKDYLSGLKEYVSNYDSKSNVEDAETDMLKKIQEYSKKYQGGSGTGAASLNLTNLINSKKFTDTDSLKNSLLGSLDSLLGTDFGSTAGGIKKSVLNINSYTACKTVGGKYCIENNGLSAKIYVVNEKSDKWAVLVHPFLMNGKQIYNALGDMYTSQGYNIIAPDLRGFGDSSGSVAMGYLESLDVYDWIKDLNSNYSRYGVSVSPKNIIVHGVSLGGATTIQLATNPDIAAKKGDPYTKTLPELNVKGFVDDCGYTSMSGIITSMLSLGDSGQSTSLLGSLNIDVDSFMNGLQSAFKDMDLSGFSDIKIDNVNKGSNLQNYLKQFSKLYEKAYDEYKKQQSAQNKPNYDQNKPNYGQNMMPDFELDIDVDDVKDWWESFIPKQTSYDVTDTSNVTLTANIFDSQSSSSLDSIVSSLLIKLVGIGLTEDNYDLYSNSFYGNRNFPSGTKVMVIHGKSDTTVPVKNADVVANKAGNKLLYKWTPTGAQHAFVVIGSNKNQYTNLIGNFTKCIADNKCSAFNSSSSTAPLDSIVE